jgi:hypothetical protein
MKIRQRRGRPRKLTIAVALSLGGLGVTTLVAVAAWQLWTPKNLLPYVGTPSSISGCVSPPSVTSTPSPASGTPDALVAPPDQSDANIKSNWSAAQMQAAVPDAQQGVDPCIDGRAPQRPPVGLPPISVSGTTPLPTSLP